MWRCRVVQKHRAQPGDAERPAELLDRVQQARRRSGLVRLNPLERFGEECGCKQSDTGAAEGESGEQPPQHSTPT